MGNMRGERKAALRTLKSIYVTDKLKRSVESDSWGPFTRVNKKNIRCSRQPPRFALLSRVHQSGAKIHVRARDWVRIPQRSSRRSRPALRQKKVSRTRATCPSPHDPSSVAFLSSNSILLQYLSTVTSTFLPYKSRTYTLITNFISLTLKISTSLSVHTIFSALERDRIF